MTTGKPQAALVLSESYVRKLDLTEMVVAEVAYPIQPGDDLQDPVTGTTYRLRNLGMIKRGGMDGILKSELMRERLFGIRGRPAQALVGRFLVKPSSGLVPWKLSVRIDQFLSDRIRCPGVADPLNVVIGTPVVVAMRASGGGLAAIGVMVVAGSASGGLTADLRLFDGATELSAGRQIHLCLGSSALASEPVFSCTIIDASSDVGLLGLPVSWAAEA
jgi:hypothetical protein